MHKVCKKSIVLLLLLVFFIFAGCNHNEKEFLPELTVPLEDASFQIVIKEWRWLSGSGAEIYYQQDGKQTLLGKTTGGDDGFCPFAAGQYSLKTEGNELIIRWAFRGSTPEEEWRESRFLLPNT